MPATTQDRKDQIIAICHDILGTIQGERRNSLTKTLVTNNNQKKTEQSYIHKSLNAELRDSQKELKDLYDKYSY